MSAGAGARPTQVMSIPVISTAHLPTSDALERLDNMRAMLGEGEGFVFMNEGEEPDHWTVPILNWLLAHGFEHDCMVRFSAEGEKIEGLPTYPWAEL